MKKITEEEVYQLSKWAYQDSQGQTVIPWGLVKYWYAARDDVEETDA